MTVTFYTTPGCPQCIVAARSMEHRGIPFAQINLAAFPTSLEYVRSLGHQQAPVTVIRDEAGAELDHWSGYRPDKILVLAQQCAALS